MQISILIAGAMVLTAVSSGSTEMIDLDRCIAEKCHRNGRYGAVQITAEQFIVYIEADRCPGLNTYCPTSYAGFTAPDGTPLETAGYKLGEKTDGTIKVYVPRQYKGLYVKGINGSKRDDFLALTDFEDFSRARDVEEVRPDVETSLDDLFVNLARAYADKDALAAAETYAEDASYLPPSGEPLRGRAAIRTAFAGIFERAGERGEELVLTFLPDERVVEGRLAYETGIYELTRKASGGESRDRGKYVVVARYERGSGWRFHVDAFSPTP